MCAFNVDQPSYQSLRSIFAERTSSIVAWVGSGLSAAVGLPTWPQLKEKLCEAAHAKLGTIAESPDRAKLQNLLFQAQAEANLWVAFGMLKKVLGATTYRDAIHRALAMANSVALPSAYSALWKMRVAGILNLNLDRLATRAHSEVLPGQTLHEFSGRDVAPHLHLLRAPQPFIANLHGTLEHGSSWVFTQEELTRLFEAQGYYEFISACFASKTVLFLGISADDIAAGGHLERLACQTIDTGTHYWITGRSDASTDAWAEAAGICVIRYATPGNSHAELDEVFADLLSYVPADDNPSPVSPRSAAVPSPSLMPEPRDLMREDAETIRGLLNAKAVSLLSDNSDGKYDRYAEFCRKYDQSIYRAWYVSVENGDNNLLGYTLKETIAAGAFGKVYRAVDKDNNPVAVKVLHEEIRKKPEMLQGFRRGVRSMHILNSHGIDGIVPYKDAYEIPAFAVMDLVEGFNLAEAYSQRRLREWNTVLRVALDLAKIIQASHHVPERVLHRDIRPVNVMIRNGWGDESEWEVVVLDFDLSWHRDARELSIQDSTTMNGFLAPEQVIRDKSASTRNAAVDSYGFGMTLRYLRTGEEPSFMQHRHADWQRCLREAANRFPHSTWASLPARYFRLIEAATRHEQSSRWDMAQISGELERLQMAADDPTQVQATELLAEEIAARGLNYDYRWDDDKLQAFVNLPTGLSVAVRGDESTRDIHLSVGWTNTGSNLHSNVKRWVPNAFDQVQAQLIRAGWKIATTSYRGAYELSTGGTIKANAVRRNMAATQQMLASVMKVLNFN